MHFYCVRIHVDTCHTEYLAILSLAFSYCFFILLSAILHSCIKTAQKLSNRKPFRHYTYCSHSQNYMPIYENWRSMPNVN